MAADAIADIQTADMAETEWRQHLQAIGDKHGFYRRVGDEHTALFARSGKTLVVTFENLEHVYGNQEGRLPWGFGFVQSRGWSILGLMAHDWTWYRDTDVFDFFDGLRDDGFFDEFDKVIFYGASMGAYAACVFSSAVPGATVIAISPQATLDRDIAGWESRYHRVWRRNFTGRYGYAPDLLKTAGRVFLFYDSYARLDAMHAALFDGANLSKFRCRFLGHRIASAFQGMGILKEIVERCVGDDLSASTFYRLLRNRREFSRYQREFLNRLEVLKRPGLVKIYCEAVLARRRGPAFRKSLNAANKQLEQDQRIRRAKRVTA